VTLYVQQTSSTYLVSSSTIFRCKIVDNQNNLERLCHQPNQSINLKHADYE